MADLEHNDDLIGDFFRNKADEYDITFSESDWQDLEKRLDHMDEKYAQRRRWRWAAAAALLIASILGYFIYANSISIRNINQKIVEKRTPERSSSSHGDLPSATGQVRPDTSTNEKKNNGANLKSSQKNSTAVPAHQNEFAHNSAQTRDNRLVNIAAKYAVNISAPVCLSCTLEKLTNEQNQIISSKNSNSEKTIPLYKALADNYAGPEAIGKRNRHPSFSRFSIGLAMSPDLSTAGSLSHFSDPGYKLGITAEYNLSSNLGISVGVIKSKVHYVASQRNYRPPSGFWTNGIRPYETDGKCLLLDIPLSLKYDFAHLGQSGFYVKGGVSSYIMLNEAYVFDYSGNSSGLVQGWSGKTGTSYWASNASFSVGYEWNVLPGLSLRAEPYIRVPIRSVGWANVNLYSVGSFISFNYKFW